MPIQPCIQAQSTASSVASTTALMQIEIKAFHLVLDQLGMDQGSDEQAIVDVLLDFFASGCLVVGEMRKLGDTLFNASNANTKQAARLAYLQERFKFRLFDHSLSFFVEDRRSGNNRS